MGRALTRTWGAVLAPLTAAAVVVGVTAPAQARTARDATAPASTTSAAGVTPQFTLAVTFDSDSVSSWTHTNQAATPVATTESTSGAGTVVRQDQGTGTIPADVASVPGVVLGDTAFGAFPAYSSVLSAQDFAGVAVSPLDPGPSDVLAPGLSDFTFGVDFRLDLPLPADARKYDGGNNVLQRGLSGDDQYKMQVDPSSGGKRLSCALRDGATGASEVVLGKVAIAGGVWYRTRCTRTVVNGSDRVVMTLTNLDTGILLETRTLSSTAPATNLDFPLASAATPTPLSVGVKIRPTGEVLKSASDQFNGWVDNAYLGIG